MELGLNNKIAVITGASKGMGKAIAESLAREGAKVLLVARNADLLKSEVDNLTKSGYTASYFQGDVIDLELPEKVLKFIEKEWNSTPDILINNAGGPPPGSVLQHSNQVWDDALQVNLFSVIRFTRAFLPFMKDKKWGRVVSITSTVAKEPSSTMVLSATLRAGVSAFTKAVSFEFASDNITLNVICPGGVLTDRLSSLIKQSAETNNRNYNEVLAESQNMIPAKRFANPDEIANTVTFLCSTAGSYITGSSIMVDGGLTKSYF
ncbi:SDR family oxidoreductase [Aquirufa salirivi]|uniref:SDR family oxidoreductase n=1 Tax=Aquirufa salirivi TaxID=3104729 RepID=A0ABW8RWU9_9BACT